MTVGDLRKALKGLKADAEVYVVGDWERVDEFGYLDDLKEVRDVHTQTVPVDDGLDFRDLTEVLIEISEP